MSYSLNKTLIAVLASTLLFNSLIASAIPEKNYQQTYQAVITPFFQSGKPFRFKSHDDKYLLSAIRFTHPNPKGIVVVLPGMSEPWLKYLEVFHELHSNGYSVFSYDHRGQGLSPHLNPKYKQALYVDSFDDYTKDLNSFLTSITSTPEKQNQPMFLVAHSMGAGIAFDYLTRFKSPFTGVAFSAPMFDIATKPVPRKITQIYSDLSVLLNWGEHYPIGQGDDDCNHSFSETKVTSSLARWQMANLICHDHPESIIGGPSIQWVKEALDQADRITRFRKSPMIETQLLNLLIIQAGIEHFVINEAQEEICSKMHRCKLVKLPDSRHEILMERDSIRAPALKMILDHFEK